MKTLFAVKVLSITAVQASANDLKYGSKYRNLALKWHILFSFGGFVELHWYLKFEQESIQQCQRLKDFSAPYTSNYCK